MSSFIIDYPQFFTATNLKCQPLLKPDKYKDIIISSMDFLVTDKRVIIYGFVIMHNHLHITCLPAGRFGKCYQALRGMQCKEIF